MSDPPATGSRAAGDLVEIPLSIEVFDWIEDRVCATGKSHDEIVNELIDAYEARNA